MPRLGGSARVRSRHRAESAEGILSQPVPRETSDMRTRPQRFPVVPAFLALLCALEFSAAKLVADTSAEAQPRNIILMIGDGMGLPQITSGRFQKGALALDDMPVVGFSETQSLEDFVTDSAAGATALASGFRVKNGAIAQHPDGSPTKTLFEYAHERGKWTGIVATSRITHATPACMVTHVASRNDEFEIAAQIAASGTHVILGGGWDKFLPFPHRRLDAPRGNPRATEVLTRATSALGRKVAAAPPAGFVHDGVPYGARPDGRHLVAEMVERGYTFVRSAPELAVAVGRGPNKIIGLFDGEAMPKVTEGRSPGLQAMAIAALRTLSQSPGGFVLMIEGSQIDWGGHDNDPGYVVQEMADFDNTLESVQRFLEKAGIADETLIVLTSDHETGGLTLTRDENSSLGCTPKFSTDSHTGAPVPVFSTGPGSRRFHGVQDHASIGRKLIRILAGDEVEFQYPITHRHPDGESTSSL